MKNDLALKCTPETKEMIQAIIELPIHLQQNIINCVSFNIRNELKEEISSFYSYRINAPVPMDRLDFLMKAAAKAQGVPMILSNRRRENVLGRTMVYAQLRSEGYSNKMIAAAVDRPLATITYSLLQFHDVFLYRKANMATIAIWDKFQELITEN